LKQLDLFEPKETEDKMSFDCKGCKHSLPSKGIVTSICQLEIGSCVKGSRYEPKTKFAGEGGTHYKQGRVVETYLLMEQVAENVYKQTSDIKKALWAAMAMKHLDRVGTKDDSDNELLKAENYIHRARIGNWIKK
jgi:hypothetical protein